MTRNVGSRASCYPPDSVSFRRFAGARADCGLPRANVDIARGAALPFGSLALASGNTRSRAGVPTASSTVWQGIARYDGKAAPTRATLQQDDSGKRPFSAAEVLDDRRPKNCSIAVDRAKQFLKVRDAQVLENREIGFNDRRAGAALSAAPWSRLHERCHRARRRQCLGPPGACGSIDRSCARRRRSSMGRDGRMRGGPNRRME